MEYLVIKLSGTLSDSTNSLSQICKFIKEIISDETGIVVVHGGGKQINELSSKMGVEVKQIEGRRVTDFETMQILQYTVGGIVNKQLVSFFRRFSLNAVGITGIDGSLTTSIRRSPLKIRDAEVDFGFVGDIESIDINIVRVLCSNGFIPVIGCLTWSHDHGNLNINADTFATELALSLNSKTLYMVMEPDAVKNSHGISMDVITKQDWLSGLEEGWITDGMVPKLKTAFNALELGVQDVILTSANGLINNIGTKISH